MADITRKDRSRVSLGISNISNFRESKSSIHFFLSASPCSSLLHSRSLAFFPLQDSHDEWPFLLFLTVPSFSQHSELSSPAFDSMPAPEKLRKGEFSAGLHRERMSYKSRVQNKLRKAEICISTKGVCFDHGAWPAGMPWSKEVCH